MNWTDALAEEKQQDYFHQMLNAVKEQRLAGKTIYPCTDDVFNALSTTPLENVKVVILGQDPYHGPGQAHGLSFSVQDGVPFPPSLQNMFKELQTDIAEFRVPMSGNLTRWAEQGVLLLNTVLTVEQGKAHSHAKLGWEQFTDKVVQVVDEHTSNTVFMLWGSHAQKKGKNINPDQHLILTAPHPSPLSAYRGFFGCKHFSRANKYLQNHGKQPIDWRL